MSFAFSVAPAGDKDGSVQIASWTGGAAGDSGAAWACPEWADIAVQVKGTISGSSVNIEGSNDGTSWDVLNNAQGSALKFTVLTDLLRQIVERPLYIRPTVVGGTGSGLSVTLCARRATPMRT